LNDFFKYKYSQLLGDDFKVNNPKIFYAMCSGSAEFFADVLLCPWETVKLKVQTVQINESGRDSQSEEIRRLEQELRDARKQIEILSSAPPPATGSTGQTAEQQKLFLILLFVSFMAGFIISAML